MTFRIECHILLIIVLDRMAIIVENAYNINQKGIKEYFILIIIKHECI